MGNADPSTASSPRRTGRRAARTSLPGVPKVVSATERAEPTYPITSVGSTLRLLLLFRERKAIRPTDASDYLGVPNFTVHRL